MGKVAEQCKTCKLGQKPIGPKSGCDIHKKLVTDMNEVAWKHSHLFLDKDDKCKSWLPVDFGYAKIKNNNTMQFNLEE